MGCQDYFATRRAMLAATGATILGMPVRSLLAKAGKDHAAKAEHVILFWNGGGMSHIDTWDPKPLAPREVRGPFGSIATAVPGIEICEHMPRMAAIMALEALGPQVPAA